MNNYKMPLPSNIADLLAQIKSDRCGGNIIMTCLIVLGGKTLK